MLHTPSTSPNPPSLHIPPELRGCIALFCDRPSLGRLSSVDRQWAAEAEPLLYQSVHLSFLCDSFGAIRKFVDGLARIPRRASWIRRLLVEYTAYGGSASHELVRALRGVLAITPNLIDLRLRGHNFDFQLYLLISIASPDCCFRLRTLYLSETYLLNARLSFDDVLRTHGESLRVLAVDSQDPRCIRGAARVEELLHPDDDRLLHADCAQCAFIRRPRYIALSVYAPSNVAAVAQSLEEDPCSRFSRTSVETLHLYGPGDEESQCVLTEISRAFGVNFPLASKVELLFPPVDTIDIDSVLEVVAPFAPRLTVLHLVDFWQGVGAPNIDLTPLQRKQWVGRFIEGGCSRLHEVKFPDSSIAERTDGCWRYSVKGAIF